MENEATEVPKYAVMVEGKSTPTKLYDDYQFAEQEAKRLAIVERKTSYVLQVVSRVELNDVKVTRL